MGLFDFFRKKKEKPVEHMSGPGEKKSEKPLEQKRVLPLRQHKEQTVEKRGNKDKVVSQQPARDTVVNKARTASEPAGARARHYTVKAGDSLSRIATEFYGNANEWQKIYQANRNRIKDPNVIHPGQRIVIP